MKITFLSTMWTDEKRVQFKTTYIPNLSNLILASLTPSKWTINVHDENQQGYFKDNDMDVLCISCMTSQADRAYYYADKYTKMGKTVIMGGPHPTFCPDEAAMFCTTVVTGEVEDIWEDILKDFEEGKLKNRYDGEISQCWMGSPIANRKLLSGSKLMTIYTIQTQRGCPWNCAYCSVRKFFGKEIRKRHISRVIEEIESFRYKRFVIVDDNVIADREYALELFQAMKGRGYKWFGQCAANIYKDEELLKAAKEAGMKVILIGFESIWEKSLRKDAHKGIVHPSQYKEVIQTVQSYDISILGSFMFGFDEDHPEIFESTLDFAIESNLPGVLFWVLTPFPGTKIFEKFAQENRFIPNQSWSDHNGNKVTFFPKHMSPYELQSKTNAMYRKFYTLASMKKRLKGMMIFPSFWIPFNFALNRISRMMDILFDPTEFMDLNPNMGIGKRNPAFVLPGGKRVFLDDSISNIA